MVIKNIKTDIAICGGGISGALAGISAARSGADVTVIERGGCLGGTLTASLVGIILDGNKKCGLVEEFLTRLSDLQKQGFAVIEESEKYLLEAMCRTLSTRLCKRSHKIYESQPCPQSKSSIPRMTPQLG